MCRRLRRRTLDPDGTAVTSDTPQCVGDYPCTPYCWGPHTTHPLKTPNTWGFLAVINLASRLLFRMASGRTAVGPRPLRHSAGATSPPDNLPLRLQGASSDPPCLVMYEESVAVSCQLSTCHCLRSAVSNPRLRPPIFKVAFALLLSGATARSSVPLEQPTCLQGPPIRCRERHSSLCCHVRAARYLRFSPQLSAVSGFQLAATAWNFRDTRRRIVRKYSGSFDVRTENI
jgi:hypothetical protein